MEKLIVKAKVKEFEINDPTQPFKIGYKLSFFIADSGISDAKTISKTIGLKPSNTPNQAP